MVEVWQRYATSMKRYTKTSKSSTIFTKTTTKNNTPNTRATNLFSKFDSNKPSNEKLFTATGAYTMLCRVQTRKNYSKST